MAHLGQNSPFYAGTKHVRIVSNIGLFFAHVHYGENVPAAVVVVQAGQMRLDLILTWEERLLITLILWLGMALGFAIGFLHATQIIAIGSNDSSPDSFFARLYRAAWAMGLWTLFGAYLLALWILAFILRQVFANTTTAGEREA
jgi:hypothetical protein